MAHVVVMPQLGNTVESCLINAWLVKVGDVVDPNTILCDIETDKSSMEVPAGVSGTVLALLAAEGDEVPVKEPIVVVGEPGEAIPDGLGTAPAAPVASAEAPVTPTAAAAPAPAPAPVATAAEGVGSSPRARGLAARKGVDVAEVGGTGPHGRVIERDVVAALAARPAGGGIGGRQLSTDTAPAPAPVASPAAAPSSSSGYTDTPLKGIRKVIAERMMNSLASSAQLTYHVTAPAAGLLALRKRLKNSDPALGLAGVTIGDLVGFAAVRTVRRHATLNAHLADNVLRTFDAVHLGMAVDTPRGLLVPTLFDADALTLRAFAERSKALAGDALGGSISPDLLGGATFTVSNLGAFGIEMFTPLLNVPQTAILGVNTITTHPVLRADGTLGAEQRIGLSLTADHRVIDGADAARYLKDLSAAIADIALTVMG